MGIFNDQTMDHYGKVKQKSNGDDENKGFEILNDRIKMSVALDMNEKQIFNYNVCMWINERTHNYKKM